MKDGETMYTVSQWYAIKLSRLYLMNNLNPGTRPSVGTVLQLRKPVKKQLPKAAPDENIREDDGEEIRIDLNIE
jgi:hypothetical protein